MATTYKEYTVKAGDHLMAIALEHLGSKTRYKEILDRNGKPLASETIHPGDVLRIPVAAPPSAPAPAPAPYFEYTVKAGDHLMAIALAHLGSKARFKEILDAKGNPIADPDKLKPGDVLRIPKK
jgi:nucleoid-associated protein YgaU